MYVRKNYLHSDVLVYLCRSRQRSKNLLETNKMYHKIMSNHYGLIYFLMYKMPYRITFSCAVVYYYFKFTCMYIVHNVGTT